MITFTHHISVGQPVTSFVKPKHVAVKGLYPCEQMSPLTLQSPGSNKTKTTKEKRQGQLLYLAPAV